MSSETLILTKGHCNQVKLLVVINQLLSVSRHEREKEVLFERLRQAERSRVEAKPEEPVTKGHSTAGQDELLLLRNENFELQNKVRQ